ncbi:DUF6600 domain-containing protein [Acidiphilium acidophilum]|uniref:DUF6600 domain-containing protein n=1 Tax=Acidiphilium acidophilum TaxID=76588 RepID=A0AAW9DW49_ACIAO|nr:DUF6600 domain-containing protein [Acidiphilium acidophilum]MDX5932918.1 DUF6600 domain-containing protein [Acidiphilium acidophilum]
MRTSFRFALALTTAVATILAGTGAASAQESPTAPPERVGQIAQLRGGVSFDTSGASDWTTAVLNYPVTGGDALYTQPGGEAAIAIDWSRISLNQATEFQITSIGSQVVQGALSQGEIYLDVRDLAPGQSYAITTARGTVTISQNGRYDILAGDQSSPTTVTVIAGAAQLQGRDVSLDIATGQTATLEGADPVTATLGPEQRDPFVTRLLAVRYAPPPSYVPQAVSQMTGGYQLAQYGTWSETPQYGAVWYPRVAASWVPYRDGHWAYVAPWGWTWVDNDPWGFAPFHYGRWIHEDGRWGWTPVAYQEPPTYQPVYAPALVSFFDVGSGVSIGVGVTAAAFAAGSIGWVPLAPDEPYLPWYHCPPRYVRQINYYNVRDPGRFADIHDRAIIDRYGPARLINWHGATVIPAAAMRRGDPVGRFGRPAPRTWLADARPVPPAAFQPGRLPGPGGAHPPGPGPIAQHGGHFDPHGFGRLPEAPGRLVHRVAAPAPRPAPFAAARGLPVGHPGPIDHATMRPPMHVMPHGAPSPNGRPEFQTHPVAAGRPMTPAITEHPRMPNMPSVPNMPRPPGPHQGPDQHKLPQQRPYTPPFHPGPQQRPQLHAPQFRSPEARPPEAGPHTVRRPTMPPQAGSPQAGRPMSPPPRPQGRPQFHPQPRVQPQQFHPPSRPQPEQFHPQPPQFHPQARPQPHQFHPRPQPQQFHPPARPQPHPQPHPPGRPNDPNDHHP